MPKPNPAFAFIFVTVMLDMLGFGIVTPVLPRLVQTLIHGDVGRTSQYMGLFISLWALMQFIASPILGVLSDRFGRRPIILISTFGLALDYVLMALAPTIAWLFVARALSGISSSTMATANAYIADITPAEERARAFGYLGGALGIGFVLGPALGGWLGTPNPRLPFWVCAGLSLLNAFYGFFILPESLPAASRQPTVRWRSANPVGSLRLITRTRSLLTLAAMTTLNYLAHEVYPTAFVLYAIYRYGWSEKTVGLSLASFGLSYMLTTAGLIAPLVRRFGERNTVFAGLLFGALGFAFYGFAATGLLFLLAMPIQSLWGLAPPPAQSLMSRQLPASEQGELQGALASLRGIAMISAPTVFAAVFASALALHRPIPGAPWFVAGLLVALALILGALLLPHDLPVP